MQPDPPPLGSAEGQHVEFKGASVLETHDGMRSVGRAVVGMLNANGGTIWVGVDEEGSRAARYEAVEDPVAQRSRLHDYLVDSIEPPPDHEDVAILIVPVERGVVLGIAVRGDSAERPYALRRGEANREYLVRVGARVRPMTRAELQVAFGGPPPEDPAVAVWAEMQHEREELVSQGFKGLWLRIAPTTDLDVPLERLDLGPLFQTAERTGNRANGWNFVNPFSAGPVLTADGARFSWGGGIVDVRLDERGGLSLTVGLEKLRHADSGTSLYPYALIEHPVAAVRLFSKVLQELGEPYPTDTEFLLDLALFGAQGWTLGPFSPHPRSPGYRLHEHRPCPADLVGLSRPIRFTLPELMTGADQWAYPAIRQLYRAFGYGSREIPREFDPGPPPRLLLD